MYYIYYELKNGNNELESFETQGEVINHLLFKGKNIKSYKIIYGREHRFVLTDKSAEYCKKCEAPLGALNSTGFCKHCFSSMREGKFDKQCTGCDSKIAKWNKSGLCKKCKDTKTSKERQRKQREKKKNREHREIKKLEENTDEEVEEIEEIEEEIPEKKELKKGKCNKCKKEFTLEDWQHSSLHWCPECRKSPDYKEYIPD